MERGPHVDLKIKKKLFLFLAPTGAQGVKMSVRPSVCVCDIMLKKSLKERQVRGISRGSSRESSKTGAEGSIKESKHRRNTI